MSEPAKTLNARVEMHEEIQKRADAIGPTDDDQYEAEEGDLWMVTEWVLVSNWTNVRDGDSRMVRLGSPDLLAHHRTGLLHEGLSQQWSDQ